MIQTGLLITVLVFALCSQGCYVTATMWERRSEAVALSASRQVVVGATQQEGERLAIDLHCPDASVAKHDPLPPGPDLRLVVDLPPSHAALLDPAAELGARRPQLRHLERIDGACWDAELRLVGHAPLAGIGAALPHEVALGYVDASPLPLDARVDPTLLRRLVDAVAPAASGRELQPIAWTHADLSPRDGSEPMDPRAIVDRRLLVRAAGDPPLVVVLRAPAMALRDGSCHVERSTLTWRLPSTGRGRIAATRKGEAPPGDARTVTIGWTERREVAFRGWALAGRVCATPLTVAADVILFTGYVMLRASLESGC